MGLVRWWAVGGDHLLLHFHLATTQTPRHSPTSLLWPTSTPFSCSTYSQPFPSSPLPHLILIFIPLPSSSSIVVTNFVTKARFPNCQLAVGKPRLVVSDYTLHSQVPQPTWSGNLTRQYMVPTHSTMWLSSQRNLKSLAHLSLPNSSHIHWSLDDEKKHLLSFSAIQHWNNKKEFFQGDVFHFQCSAQDWNPKAVNNATNNWWVG